MYIIYIYVKKILIKKNISVKFENSKSEKKVKYM